MASIDRGRLPADLRHASPSVMDEDDDLDESESAENNIRLSLESTKSLPTAYRRHLPDDRMLHTTSRSRQEPPRIEADDA